MTRGGTIWLTGLSGAGKSTIAREIERRLREQQRAVCVLDGDQLRAGLNSDLGFAAGDRSENVRRVSEIARILADAGIVAVVALISPYQTGRDKARRLHEQDGLAFVEVFVSTPLGVCAQRDPKGLYARAGNGELQLLTGVSDTYEPPVKPDLEVNTENEDAAQAAERILRRFESALAAPAGGA